MTDQPVAKMVEVAPGVSLFTEAWGEPEKGTFLLAMGATASMVWWPDGLMQALADAGYRAIRFDHRDTGQSTTGAPGEVNYDLDALTGDLLAILDAYEVEQAHLAGMSLGGYVAQILALRQPERVLSLTLIASEPLGQDYQGEGISDDFMAHFGAMKTLDWSDRDAVGDFLLGAARLSAGSKPGFQEGEARRRVETEISRASTIQSAFNHSMVGGNVDGLDVAAISQPVLVVHGTEDPIIAVAAGRKTAEVVKDSRLVLLEGRGHELLKQDVGVIAGAMVEVAKQN
ncbi:MAG: alpha/beta hydrolase [Candidatus Devosia phytovorans]|uniref:Alpha/beta hydrolase n=1 Tax=Candidatus Devosia phytovorans TaxID=3121372 RepID=A0AAJ5VUZ1_9HYPH|nr:alpha/beta hydrolase [Devosia sp.]WEK03948.1 MAG: alpha/beta hydrolase [Devosia sp.]